MAGTAQFTPAPGRTPPHLAGRETEQDWFKNELGHLVEGGSAEHAVVYGPRGMGKTVLLKWLQEQCKEVKAEPVYATPATRLKSESDIPRLLLPADWHRKWWLPREVKMRGQLPGILSLTAKFGAGDKAGEGGLEDHAIAAGKGRPRVLLIDEAHAIEDLGLYRTLFNAVQTISDQAPLILVLAGTPGLLPLLRKTGATFMERAPRIGLGALDHAKAIEAIRVPMKKNGVQVPNAQLGYMAGEAQGYPYFLQVWGKALWNAVQRKSGGRARVTQAHVDTAQQAFDKRRDAFYQERYDDMGKDRALLRAACEVGRRFLAKRPMAPNGIREVIKATLPASTEGDEAREGKAMEIHDKLDSLDYFWSPPGKPPIPASPASCPTFRPGSRGR